ncbi:MAG TPA: sialidase family protein [Blastocatellia bacterium]|nr:sialidase family protein [Blastocatellia bacterium]
MKMFYLRLVLVVLLLSCSIRLNPAGSAARLPEEPGGPRLVLDVPASPAADPDPRDETSIAVSPINDQIIVGVSKDIVGGGDPQVRGVTRVAYYFSSDGGRTWGNNLLGLETPQKVWGRASDPSVAADLNGNFYICALMLDNSNFDTSVYVFKSTDGGRTFGDPSPVVLDIANPNPRLIDKCYMTVDASASSAFKNTVYAVWTMKAIQDSGQDLSVIRSAHRRPGDAGFSEPKTISHPGIMMGASLATGPNGEFYAAWIGLPAQVILFNASTDGGVTFLPADVTTSDVDIHDLVGSLEEPSPALRILGMERMHSYPVLDVDRSTGPNRGSIYVAWAETTNRRNADVFVEKLPPPNGGNPQHSSPVKVNNDGSGTDQFFPWLSVDPTNGWVEVGFYDRRDDPNDLLNNMYLAHSTDGGATFGENTRVSEVSSDPRIQSQVGGAFGSFIGLGDYLGMVATRGKAHMFWADTRRGKQDVFYGQIDFNQSAPPPGDAPPNDGCLNPRVITSLPYQDTLDTTKATSSSDDPVSCTGAGDSSTVWYAITPAQSGIYGIDTTGSNYDTVVSVYKGGCGALTPVTCNDDFSNPTVTGKQSLLTFGVEPGVTYLIEASGKGTGGLLKIRVGYPTISDIHFTSVPFGDALEIFGAGFVSQNAVVTAQMDGEDLSLPNVFFLGPPLMDGKDTFVYASRKKLKKIVKRGSLLVRVESPAGSGNISNSFLFTK